MELNKGDKAIYLGNMPYILGNGQQVEKYGDELVINNKVIVGRKDLFQKVKQVKPEVKEVVVEKKETKKPSSK
jgi:hypothetical protein